MKISKKDLVVKPSSLPGTGKGLFTRIFIPKGTRIIEYKGRIITWKDFDADNPFVYSIHRNHVIDARPFKKALARYANDARGIYSVKGIGNNSKYVEDGLRVFIEATKDIQQARRSLLRMGKNIGMRYAII